MKKIYKFVKYSNISASKFINNQILTEGKYYKCESEKGVVRIYDHIDVISIFGKEFFDTCFIDIKEDRKQKLLKLNE